jgi:alkylated DNA nucleotide flippase Atl1
MLAATFAAVAGLGCLGAWVAARLIVPAEIRFGTVVTFRDLAEVIGADGSNDLGDTVDRQSRHRRLPLVRATVR